MKINNNKITEIIVYLIYLAIPMLILYFIYQKFLKSPLGKVAKFGNDFIKTGEEIYLKAGNAISAIIEPLDENLTEEEKSEYITTFAKESVKNILDPREWYENLSYWWS